MILKNSLKYTPEFSAEYKRVSISLHTHISELDEHTLRFKHGLNGTVLFRALSSLYVGPVKVTLKVPLKKVLGKFKKGFISYDNQIATEIISLCIDNKNICIIFRKTTASSP